MGLSLRRRSVGVLVAALVTVAGTGLAAGTAGAAPPPSGPPTGGGHAVAHAPSQPLPSTAPPRLVVPSSWAKVPSPNTSPSTVNELYGDSCPTATFCVAVGYAGQDTLVETWNGSAWSITPSPNAPAPSTGDELDNVSCTNATFCMAVGYNFLTTVGTPLVEAWDGSTWTIVPTPPTGATHTYLDAVSCLSPTACTAAGYEDTPAAYTPLAETWNGSAWTVAATVNPAGSTDSEFDAVSCATASFCVATGYVDVAGNDRTLIETWRGSTWSITPSPNTSTTEDNYLSSVSCASPTVCSAVGYASTPSTLTGEDNLVLDWNGSTWSIAPAPSAGTNGGGLDAVDCFGPTSCVAVGYIYGSASYNNYLNEVLTWNGSTWTSESVPSASTADYLSGVSCVPGSTCTAVGSTEVASQYQTSILTSSVARPGYLEVASDGGIFAFGGAPFKGSMGGQHLNAPIVGIAETPDGGGYWEVASDGGIFAFGDATFFGSMGGQHLNAPIVGIGVTPSGDGYFEVASDGGLFAFGDARFAGSMGGQHLNQPVVGIGVTPTGGYDEVASDGGMFSFGGAPFLGSQGGHPLNKPMVGMTVTAAGGYYQVASDGGLFAYGAPFLGSMGGLPLNLPVVGMAATPTGYYEVASDGGLFSFHAPFSGSMGGQHLNAPIVGMAD
jgi:hypothetical protein